MKTELRLPPSQDVSFVYLFSTKLARERKALGIELRDLLAGMYLLSLERLGRYWDQWEHFEDFVTFECSLSQPRFFYWFELWESLRDSKGSMEGLASFTSETSTIIGEANKLAHGQGCDETRIEHLLAALAASKVDLCQRLVASGMNVDLVRSSLQKIRK